MVRWLNDQVATYRMRIPGLVVANDMDRARTATGALMAYEEILAVFQPAPVELAIAEDSFTDPAERLSLRSKR